MTMCCMTRNCVYNNGAIDVYYYLSKCQILANSSSVAKASYIRVRETGFESFAAVSNTEQVASLYIAPVYSAV